MDDASPASRPKKKQSCRSSKGKSGNPYSARGLDKFYSVVSELEAKRERILARAGSSGAPMVRFMYTNSRNWIPIIVRRGQEKRNDAANRPAPTRKANTREAERGAAVPAKREKKRTWRPSYYIPVALVLTLLCLAVLGRVFAICCTSAWWFVVPRLRGGEEGSSGAGRRIPLVQWKESDNRRGIRTGC
ncbi:hypothetical protein HPP92_005791 [Vanilla planifolia]|uniref:Uncharacterized protein n=1 Tax=Vanilla planifolia TaxID=51239 RepID=A0A835RJN8_VANPL|nr:hypothetical protein HPP92_006077 [Vanilla planifolia]KAG0494797.1 hypothetical protein HPP92_005791 [Vanilla planifolia]